MLIIISLGIAFGVGFVLGLSTGLNMHPVESEEKYYSSLWKDYHWEYKKEPKNEP